MVIKFNFLSKFTAQRKNVSSDRMLTRWLPILLLGSIVTVSAYVVYGYYELKEERENSIYISRLSGVTQQLRQTIYNAFYGEKIQLRQLEKDAQHFRYLLLQTESQLIGQHWKNLQHLLLNADLFIEDVDNLLVSAYSISNFTRQLNSWQNNSDTPAFRDIVNDISRFMVLDAKWYFGERIDDDKKFTSFLSDIEKRLHQNTQILGDDILIIHTGLTRLMRQFQRMDKVTNHSFIHEIANYQNIWSLKMLNLVEQINNAFLFLLLLVGAHWALLQFNYRSKRNILSTDSEEQDAKNSSVSASVDLYAQLVEFDSTYLLEQLDYCYESYESILNMFIVEHQDDVKALKYHVESHDFSGAHNVTHKLKGVAGNIGALTLESLCKELDDIFRNNLLPNAERLDVFENVFTLTFQQISTQLNESKLKTMA